MPRIVVCGQKALALTFKLDYPCCALSREFSERAVVYTYIVYLYMYNVCEVLVVCVCGGGGWLGSEGN